MFIYINLYFLSYFKKLNIFFLIGILLIIRKNNYLSIDSKIVFKYKILIMLNFKK
jgi:hypothetical protein